MIPIVTPAEMRRHDAESPVPVEVLVERAGAAVARAALAMLDGAYGRHVVVVAGPGFNGADGRVAARRLAARGARVRVVDAADAAGTTMRDVDLVVDAAFGTGLRDSWSAPRAPGARVLAVDIPSGVDGLTGAGGPGVARADQTVTLAALKPGLLLHPGRELSGEVSVADIGLEMVGVRSHLVQADDVAGWLPHQDPTTHKWRRGVRVVAGSPSMAGAADLCTRAAMRAGAGMVHLSHPERTASTPGPTEVVAVPVSGPEWIGEVLADLARFASMVIGPGMGRSADLDRALVELIATADLPLVVDGDALGALGDASSGPAQVLTQRRAATVLTPHDGEVVRLTGSAPGADRFATARDLARSLGAIVVLKGPTTIVAEPEGATLAVTAPDARLATAGTGDVLAGIIAAMLAGGQDPFYAAAAGVWIHGASAALGPRMGLVAGDLIDRIPQVWSKLMDTDGPT